jgi:hypothetical protein
MAQSLGELLQTIEVDGLQEASGFQAFALRAPGDGLSYLTMDEALEAGAWEITEVTEKGQVPTLKVLNRSDRMVFLMAGEQVIGAKQNRVLNASYMVAARSEMPVPVSCVEAGRWRTMSPKFSSGHNMSHSKLRKLMSKHASEGYHAGGSPSSKQGEVWEEVGRKLDAMGSSSPSHALHQVYEDHERRLADLLGQFKVPEGHRGAAFVVAGRIAGVDLFDQPATLEKLWPKLIRGYALDALEPESPAPPASVESIGGWIRGAAAAQVEPFRSPGLGMDLRLSGAGLIGASLVVEDCPVHLELFPTDVPAEA